mgnify:FL=1
MPATQLSLYSMGDNRYVWGNMASQLVYQAPTKQITPQSAGMRFQERDGEILQAIYERDGVMAKRQLKILFWPEKTDRAMEKRLTKLYRLGYLDWPGSLDWRTKPIPEPICWLGAKGVLWVAARNGVTLDIPHGENETWKRRLEVKLREQGIYWMREPRWIQLQHDIRVGDFRLITEQAISADPSWQLETWQHEGVFRSHVDTVEYSVVGLDGQPKKIRKGVIPDSFFMLQDTGTGQTRARVLLELDMATQDNPRFGREKVLPGINYILSSQYKARFGDNSGRWLVVTTGERRMQNLKRQAESVAGRAAGAFYFTTFERVSPQTILSQPIWYRGGENITTALLAQ